MKNKKVLFLISALILLVGIIFVIQLNNKNDTETKASTTKSTETTDVYSKSSVIDHSDETDISYSYEKVTMSMEELGKYRSEIEQAGFDSTQFTDQDVQTMAEKIKKSGQSLKDYLKDLDIEKIDDDEIENARESLRDAGIDPDKMHNNEIVELLKQAKKEKKSVVDVAKEKQ
ncbi:hypothetical protein [Enterococcus wangshanyuanii]|uniref:Uncharacterized protein n=1 Tax=Enterococcus wangshanyuanii TaxID=2005703 RepID=A0ABQ1PLE1_9ENTE|nr:hypothetical protein [Enterococcus wangshanyuanii]GGC99258.1 hypothetical protein GCM10011573_31050 [Enterococcus wangshanyuanii]